jgi:hypothetical protein
MSDEFVEREARDERMREREAHKRATRINRSQTARNVTVARE